MTELAGGFKVGDVVDWVPGAYWSSWTTWPGPLTVLGHGFRPGWSIEVRASNGSKGSFAANRFRKIESPGTPVLLGITGWIGSGKDTIADRLVTSHGFVKFAMSDFVQDVLFAVNPHVMTAYDGPVLLRDLGGTRESRKRDYPDIRRMLNALGAEIRVYDPEFWVNCARRQIGNLLARGDKRIVVTGIRYRNEERMIRELGGKVWAVQGRRGEQCTPSFDVFDIMFDAEKWCFNASTLDDLNAWVDRTIQWTAPHLFPRSEPLKVGDWLVRVGRDRVVSGPDECIGSQYEVTSIGDNNWVDVRREGDAARLTYSPDYIRENFVRIDSPLKPFVKVEPPIVVGDESWVYVFGNHDNTGSNVRILAADAEGVVKAEFPDGYICDWDLDDFRHRFVKLDAPLRGVVTSTEEV